MSDLAALCGISAGHLSRAFKQSTGKKVHAYVENVRLRRATELLLQSDLSVKEIAARVGFTNPSTFSASFLRLSGITPTELRRRYQSERPRKLAVQRMKNFEGMFGFHGTLDRFIAA